ncbi:MAG: hypothetical protein JRJ66_02090 [Deltaproteobacteria bacterium]|nr:hypothetical protein [Deltaproteobacteria bacterium]
MAAKSETLQLIIKAKDAASGELAVVNRSLKAVRGTLNSLPKMIFNLKTAFAGLGLGLTAKQFIDAASSAEQYQTRLRVLLGSSKEGNRLFQEMADYAGKVSFRYEEIMGAATNLAGVMKGGTDEVKQWMPLIGDLAAATGMSIEETTGQVIRMYSAGAASADMFRERGVLAMLGFQAGVSYSAEETRKKLMEAWKDPASQFRGAAGELGKTWSGMLSMLSDAWFQFRTLVMEAGLFDYIKALVGTFLGFLKRLKTEGRLDEFAKGMAKKVLVAINVIIRGFAAVLEAITLMKRGFEGIKFILNAIVLVFSKLVEKITGGLGKLARFVGLKGVAGRLEGISEGFRSASQVAAKEMDKSAKRMIELAKKQGKYWKGVGQFIEDVKDKAQELGEVQEKEGKKEGITLKPPAPVDTKAIQAQQEAYVARLKETTKTALLILERAYKHGEVKLNEYFERRKALIVKQYEEEIKLAEQAAEREADPAKKIQLNNKVFALREQLNRELIKLEEDRAEKQKQLEEKELERRKILEALKARAVEDAAGNLAAQFAKEMGELDRRHQEEIQRLRELNATKAELDEAYRQQKLEKDKLAADQERRLYEYRLQLASDVAKGMADVFNEVYEISGKKRKEFFYLAKAAALAEAIINTSQAITKALAQGGIWGMAQAAVIGAKGSMQIAKITAQQLASGGLVFGVSPHSKADDKLVAVTSGEYIHPVDTVKYYGLKAMEALKNKLVPREVLAGFSVPTPAFQAPRTAFAGGGAVSGTAGIERGRDIVIANFYDVDEFARFLLTARGQDAVINVISERRESVRRALSS